MITKYGVKEHREILNVLILLEKNYVWARKNV